MWTRKLTLSALAALACAGGIFGGWKFHLASETKRALADATRHQEKIAADIAAFDVRRAAAAASADAIARDNALLAASLEKARLAADSEAVPRPALTRQQAEDRIKRAQQLAQHGDPDEALRELLVEKG